VKTVFFGTPAFAVPTLERLLASPHSVAGVVTQPDRPRGRGQRVSASPVKTVATANALPVFQPERMQDPDFIAALEELKPDLGVIAAYGKLLPDGLLKLPRLGMINVHASLLPKYRGAAPIHRAIMAGERESGITIIKLVHEMDAGPMLHWKSIPIEPDDTSASLEPRLAKLGAELLIATIDALDTHTITQHEQDKYQVTFAPRLTRDDGQIDWTKTAPQIHNQVRGLHPWPHAFGYLDGVRYLLLHTQVVERPVQNSSAETPVDGQVLEAKKDRLIVATGRHTALALLNLQPEGRRPLTARAFLAGHRLSPGATFRPTCS
jgi:methionyl-tRNA formyltransferase